VVVEEVDALDYLCVADRKKNDAPPDQPYVFDIGEDLDARILAPRREEALGRAAVVDEVDVRGVVPTTPPGAVPAHRGRNTPAAATGARVGRVVE